MNRFALRIACFIASCFVLTSLPGAAQNIVPVRIDGQALLYLKAGVSEGCGIRIFAAVPAVRGDWQTFDVSVNVWKSGLAVVKALSANTTPEDDDGRSILYATELDRVLPWFIAQAAGETVLVGLRRRGDPGERIYTGTIQLSDGDRA